MVNHPLVVFKLTNVLLARKVITLLWHLNILLKCTNFREYDKINRTLYQSLFIPDKNLNGFFKIVQKQKFRQTEVYNSHANILKVLSESFKGTLKIIRAKYTFPLSPVV